MRKKTEAEQREWFWQQVDKTGSCWLWTRTRQASGYGMLRSGGRMVLTHRFAWESFHGPIQSGLEVCHRCDNPPCVNPDHLFLGSHLANMVDAHEKGRLPVPNNGYAARTHCKNGHAFTADNIGIAKGRRRCLTCKREQTRRSRATA